MMVDNYLAISRNPDYTRGQAIMVGGYPTDVTLWDLGDDGHGTQHGVPYLNRNPKTRASVTNHWIAASWWHRANAILSASRHDVSLKPLFFEIEPWMDIHIDTEEDWEMAEDWFRRKILSKGADCYETYRRSWAG